MKKKKIASFIKKIIGVIARIAGKLTDEYKKRSEYGFIYILVSILVKVLCVLNLVEWFKLVFYKICRLFQKGISCRAAKNWAIDIFIVLKFIFLFVAIKMHPNPIIVKVVVYLLLMNVFTYFYYHVWRKSTDNCSHWQTRRFVSLMLAIVFNILCYTYLFWNGLSESIVWENGTPTDLYNVFQYSISNTFLVPSPLSVINTFGIYLQTSQQLVSFIFLAIILSQSIPISSGEE